MITIDLLKTHPTAIPRLSAIWQEVLGRIWIPDTPIEHVIQRFEAHLNEDTLPLTFVALEGDEPLGMCSLRKNDGITSNFTPWLGSLVVDPKYQRSGIGKILIDTTKKKALELGFKKLYLIVFDPTVHNYYMHLGWKKIGMDECVGHPVTVMEVEL